MPLQEIRTRLPSRQENQSVTRVDGEPQQILQQALDQLQSALDLLDSGSAPPHIAAHVDLALNQLEAYLEKAFPPSEPRS